MTASRARVATCAAFALIVFPLAVAVGATRAAAPATATTSASSLTMTAAPTSIRPNAASRVSATWCGTPSQIDATPNAVAGDAVHWIYAIPSDGQDRFSSFASVMQTDAEIVDGWWRSQDSVRTPRFDVAPFPCGVQLDLSSVRLTQSGAQLASSESPFEQIWDTLVPRGFNSPHSKLVVYYDGPVGNNRICGAGATVPRSLGMAMYYVQSCPGIASAEVAAHELLHAMGAVPSGAPHMCAPPDGGHTCDTTQDLMFPYSDGTPLNGLLLDPGRDDYYGHAGQWPDMQDSPWLVQLDRQAPLNLTIGGPGRVVADIPGLDCSKSCSTTWNAGTRLVLTPLPSPGAKLVRWSGPCAGLSQCVVVVGQGSSASALFAPATYRLSVRVSGKGSVSSSSPGIACPGRCTSPFTSHAPLRLSASPAKGWRLKTWAGACRGKRATCTLPMTANSSTRAVFVRR
jgi:hypothetical protein